MTFGKKMLGPPLGASLGSFGAGVDAAAMMQSSRPLTNADIAAMQNVGMSGDDGYRNAARLTCWTSTADCAYPGDSDYSEFLIFVDEVLEAIKAKL